MTPGVDDTIPKKPDVSMRVVRRPSGNFSLRLNDYDHNATFENCLEQSNARNVHPGSLVSAFLTQDPLLLVRFALFDDLVLALLATDCDDVHFQGEVTINADSTYTVKGQAMAHHPDFEKLFGMRELQYDYQQ